MTSGISTIFLPSDPNELSGKIKLLLEEKQAADNSSKINEAIFAKIDKLLEYKRITHTQHKKLFKKFILI